MEELTDIGGSGSRILDAEEGTDIGVAAEAAAPKIAIKLASVTQTEPTQSWSAVMWGFGASSGFAGRRLRKHLAQR